MKSLVKICFTRLNRNHRKEIIQMSAIVSESMHRASERKIFKPFDVPDRLLFSPGPTPVPASVLQAMTKTVLGHLDPRFLQCMDEIKEMLQYVFETTNCVTLPVSATGSGGMEAAIFNAVERGDGV